MRSRVRYAECLWVYARTASRLSDKACTRQAPVPIRVGNHDQFADAERRGASHAVALFPFPVVLLRVAVPIVLITLVPWLTRGVQLAEANCAVGVGLGWLYSTAFMVKKYLKNLARLAATTVPLMILAGIQGAVLVELLSAKDLPSKIMLLGIVLVGIVGTFLPVPIALFLLLKRGVPMPHVATLPCTLGAFSGYSLLILGTHNLLADGLRGSFWPRGGRSPCPNPF